MVCVCGGGGAPSLFCDDLKHDSIVLERGSTREGGASMDVKRHGSMSRVVLSRITRTENKL